MNNIPRNDNLQELIRIKPFCQHLEFLREDPAVIMEPKDIQII